MYTIAIFNSQEGVGKTAVTLNLGHALALAGHQVTLVDFDPAGDLSTALGLFRQPAQGIDQVLTDAVDFETVAISTRDEMHLIPSGSRLAELERAEHPGMKQGLLLQQALLKGMPGQAFMLFDCPSVSELLVANALLGVDMALIPVSGDAAGAESLPHLLETVRRFSAARGGALRYTIVMNRIPARRRLTGVAVSKFSGLAPENFLQTVICQSELITEARKMGRTVFEYRAHSRSAADFRQLAGELLRRIELDR
ncbi:ParA family protein [Sedimenticola sp.]|uniref:ParA family protein n=1 Tax=Sedimenticola sp. TaxID=1940285 RepID=UPI003D0CCB77